MKPIPSARSALSALLVAAAGTAGASPPVWEMAVGEGKLRIAGSVHYLRDEDYPLPEVLRRAYADSEILVVEYDTRAQGQPVEPTVLVRRVPRPGRLDPPGPLRRHLSTPEFTNLRRLARERGFDVDDLDDLKPWFAGMYVMETALAEAGFSSELGLDNRLLDLAHDDGKPVISLESESDQRRLFGGVAMADQVNFLTEALRDAPRMGAAMTRVVESWKRGELAVLEKSLLKNLKRRPEEYRRFSVERNRRWAERLARLPGGGDDYLVVVGVVHLLGDASLIAMLRDRGYSVRRLESPDSLDASPPAPASSER